MNKAEFVAEYAKKFEVSKTEAAKIVDNFTGLIVDMLSEGNEDVIRFIKFGTFKVVDVKEKVVRNPQNGKEMTVPASKRPKFVPGKEFKDSVNA